MNLHTVRRARQARLLIVIELVLDVVALDKGHDPADAIGPASLCPRSDGRLRELGPDAVAVKPAVGVGPDIGAENNGRGAAEEGVCPLLQRRLLGLFA